MKRKDVFLGFFLTVTFLFIGNAQTVTDVFGKVANYYTKIPEYQLQMTYTLLRGLKGNRVTESYTGTMTKIGTYSKISILNTEVFQFSEARIIIDQSRKIVTYLEATDQNTTESPVDVSTFLKYYPKAQLIDKGDYWQCEMVAEKNVLSNLPYGKVILNINKNDYRILKQELFFSNLIPFKDKNGKVQEQDYGRLIIKLEHLDKVDKKVAVVEDFILKTAGNKIKLQQEYATYELIDQTEYDK